MHINGLLSGFRALYIASAKSRLSKFINDVCTCMQYIV